jgi:excinuclease ABC subunit B
MPEDQMQRALTEIREELDARLIELRHEGKLLEAQRLQARTRYDLEMIEEVNFCSGIENYSRFFDGRKVGEKPFTLLDYFDHVPGHAPGDWLLLIDESHVTIPQVRAMYNGDQARKKVLVEHGFRLPSALDNRPLRFEEFEQVVPQIVFVSATPAQYELEKSQGHIAEQVIRPTGLVDPEITIKPAVNQIPDLIERCKTMAARDERVIVTALTKKLCEELTRYLTEQGLSARYLHSSIETLDRIEILRALRAGDFDILVGVNLLREGLDLPEVSLVAILDADKEGFLRSATSLIQQIGRCARNLNAQVIMYADKTTRAMAEAIDETSRRREKQLAFNKENNITPTQIIKAIRMGIENEVRANRTVQSAIALSEPEFERDELIATLEAEMLYAAEQLDFERAATLRDQVKDLKSQPADTKVRRSEVKKKQRRKNAVQPGQYTPGMPRPRFH